MISNEDKEKLLTSVIVKALKNMMTNKTSSTPESKFFNMDGTRANDVAPNRDDTISEDEVKQTVKEVIDGIKDLNAVDSISVINDPDKVTPYASHGLTPEQRNWLLNYIFAVEGKYFNHPNDPGGETMYGIIKREARAYGYNGAMREMPKEIAIEIYLKKYWNGNQLDKIDDYIVGIVIFDLLVNGGMVGGTKTAQIAVNRYLKSLGELPSGYKEDAIAKAPHPLIVDGKMGPNTIKAINAVPSEIFINNFFAAQSDRYNKIQNANTKLRAFDDGWQNRMAIKASFIYIMRQVLAKKGD